MTREEWNSLSIGNIITWQDQPALYEIVSKDSHLNTFTYKVTWQDNRESPVKITSPENYNLVVDRTKQGRFNLIDD